MGTRADFYIKEDDSLRWLGSIAWDGYDIGNVSEAKTPEGYISLLNDFLLSRDDATFPNMGWPWPWKNSKLTGKCYIFQDGEVWKVIEKIGDYRDHTTPLVFTPFHSKSDGKKIEICVPDMSPLENIAFGKRSGLVFMQGNEVY